MAPGIGDAGHNISPPLDEQLILELEGRVEVLELLALLPGRLLCRKTVPLDEDVPNSPTKLGAQDAVGRWKQTTILHRRKGRRRRRRWIPLVRLEEADMEDVVQAGALRKLELVGHRPDALPHLEGPGAARPKLALGAWLQGLGGAMEKTQPHPIPNRELQLTMGGVIVLLGDLLRLEESLADLSQHLITITEEVVDGVDPSQHCPVRQQWWRRAPVDHLERSGA